MAQSEAVQVLACLHLEVSNVQMARKPMQQLSAATSQFFSQLAPQPSLVRQAPQPSLVSRAALLLLEGQQCHHLALPVALGARAGQAALVALPMALFELSHH